MNFQEAWEFYKKDKILLNYSPHTLKGYAIQCRLLKEHFNNANINNITKQQLKDYLFKQDHLKPQSLGHRIRFIRSFFRWAIDEGYISFNPSSTLKEPKMGERIPKFLFEEDIEHLREACKTRRERAIFEFLFNTGSRIGEAQKVNIKDIDWEKNCLIVNGKGNKEREVYFAITCRIWLKKYLEERTDDCPALFVTERKPIRRLGIDQLRRVLKDIAKNAGLSENVYPHRLRHSMATHLLNRGCPIEAIQQMLGHAKSETTQIYANLSGDRRREMYKKYF